MKNFTAIQLSNKHVQSQLRIRMKFCLSFKQENYTESTSDNMKIILGKKKKKLIKFKIPYEEVNHAKK